MPKRKAVVILELETEFKISELKSRGWWAVAFADTTTEVQQVQANLIRPHKKKAKKKAKAGGKKKVTKKRVTKKAKKKTAKKKAVRRRK